MEETKYQVYELYGVGGKTMLGSEMSLYGATLMAKAWFEDNMGSEGVSIEIRKIEKHMEYCE